MIVIGSRNIYRALSSIHAQVIYKSIVDLCQSVSTVRDVPIIMCASPYLAKVRHGFNYPQNFSGLLINNLRNTHPTKIIFISSASVYGLRSPRDYIVSESAETRGVSEYSREKIALENLLSNFCEVEKIPLVIFRPSGFYNFSILEPINLIDRLSSASFGLSTQHFKIENKGLQIRDFCDYQTFIKLIFKAFQSEKYSGIINLSTTKPIKICDLINSFNITNADLMDYNNHDIHCALNTTKVQSLERNINFQCDLRTITEKGK